MDTNAVHTVAGVSTLLVLAGTGAAAMAPQPALASDDVPAVAAAQTSVAQMVQVPVVEGIFGFSQGQEVSSNEWIYRNLAQGSRYLCGARTGAEEPGRAAEDWTIEVRGAVDNAFVATAEEIATSDAVQRVVMGCSCLGNPADGRAVADALVQGIPATALIALAQPQEGVNTVVFVSADGYEVALPLSFLQSRYCPIVFDVNGSNLAQSMGGTNQLWLGSTPASYFVRDVVAVVLEQRATPPLDPTCEEARASYEANLPNVGVLLGGEVA